MHSKTQNRTVRGLAGATVVAAITGGLAMVGAGLAAAAPTETPYPTQQACETTINFYEPQPGYSYYCAYYPDAPPPEGHFSGNGPGWYIGMLK